MNQNVQIIKESKIIGNNSKRFWISAINVERKFKLSNIKATLSSHNSQCDIAGQIIGILMHVANVKVLGTTHLITTHTLQCHNTLAAVFNNLNKDCFFENAIISS